jgi:hypothetical protein
MWWDIKWWSKDRMQARPEPDKRRTRPEPWICHKIVIAKAENPDGSCAFVAMSPSELKFASGKTPLEALGAFAILHHDTIGLGYLETGGGPLPELSVETRVTLAIMKSETGVSAAVASKRVEARVCECKHPAPTSLDWRVFGPEPSACHAAGMAILGSIPFVLHIRLEYQGKEPLRPREPKARDTKDHSGGCEHGCSDGCCGL